MKLKVLFFVIMSNLGGYAAAQLQDLKGRIIAANDVEGIHILNKTSIKYAVSDHNGDFLIPVKLNDTLTVTGLAYKTKRIVISQKILKNNNLKVYLEVKVNELDQVLIGKILTGNLNSDLNNTQVKSPINFYDLGIPGYTGKQKTLSERKLAANSGGGGIPLVGLINAITGKTKELKARIKLEREILCVNKMKDQYQSLIFEDEDFSETLINRFFDFILDSEKLHTVCPSGTSFKRIEFIKTELKLFKSRLTKND